MSEIVFIRDHGQRSDVRSLRIHELERSKARSFAARVSHAERRKRRSIRPRSMDQNHDRSVMPSETSIISCSSACYCELCNDLEKQKRHRTMRRLQVYAAEGIISVHQEIMKIPVSKELWNGPEERIAFQHWQSVTAPWLSHFHASPQGKFWDIVVPQAAQEFTPVRYLLVAFELVDLPAFSTETLANRREKHMGYYNTAIQMLQKSTWPGVCIIVTCLLAYALESRWTNVESAQMHLTSCQKLIKDFRHDPHQANNSLMFVEAVDDTIQHGLQFLRVHARLHLLKNKFGWTPAVYGITKMPELSPTGKSLVDYLVEFKMFVEDILTHIPSDLYFFDASEATRRFESWDEAVHRLCQLGKITNAVSTVSSMLCYIGLFLIPFYNNGFLDVYPDALMCDYILRVFHDQLLRPLGPGERRDMELVIQLGLNTILRFPHEPRHATEAESLKRLMSTAQFTTSKAWPVEP